jgi:hypothetical protein
MSAIAASAGPCGAARRKALYELLRRELRTAHAGLLTAGAAPPAVSRLLDERISLLSADALLAAERRARGRSAHDRPDDAEDLADDPVDFDGVGQ